MRPVPLKAMNLFALALAGLCTAALAQLPTPAATATAYPRSIQVMGSAADTVVPDIGHVTIGATERGKQLPAVMERMEKSLSRLNPLLKRYGLKPADVRTAVLNVQPVYDFRDGRREFQGYEATKQLRVTFRNLDSLRAFLSKAMGEGPNELHGVQFEYSKMDSVQKAVVVSAVEDARQMAQAMAQKLGVKAGRVLHMSNTGTNPGQPGPIPMYERAMAMKDAGGGGGLFEVQPGILVVQEQALAVFAIE